jgi:hypothetical protein
VWESNPWIRPRDQAQRASYQSKIRAEIDRRIEREEIQGARLRRLGWESEEERERIARDIKRSLFSGNRTNERGNDYLVRGSTEGGEGKNFSNQESNGGRWLQTTGNQIEERKHKDRGI